MLLTRTRYELESGRPSKSQPMAGSGCPKARHSRPSSPLGLFICSLKMRLKLGGESERIGEQERERERKKGFKKGCSELEIEAGQLFVSPL